MSAKQERGVPEGIGTPEVESKGPLPRVTPTEYYARIDVTTPDVRLERLGDIFGPKIIEAAVEESDKRKTVTVESEVETDPPRVHRVVFENSGGSGSKRIRLSPEMQEQLGIPSGEAYPAPTDGKVYRKAQPEHIEPIAEVGDVLQPIDGVCVFMEGKDHWWIVEAPSRLNGKDLSKGMRLTGFAPSIHDDGDWKRGDPIFYVEAVE